MPRTSLEWGKLYLFWNPGNDKLIITAHGGKRTNRASLPKSATLWFCGRHGKSTTTDADDLVTALSGDTQRFNQIKQAGFHPNPIGDPFDYDLSKFAGDHGGGEYENYDEYEKMAAKGFDIVSPRNRWYSGEVTLSLVLKQSEIKKRHYKNIYCTFCRS